MTTTEEARLPFELRIHAIEARIFGTSHGGQAAAAAGPASERSIRRRIEDIEEAIERTARGSEALRRLIDGYQQYLPLLTLPDHQGRSEDDKSSEDVVHESDLLPDGTKLTMVLEAAGDIRHSERVLRDIELLQKQEVHGSGKLQELLPHRSALIRGVEDNQSRSAEIRATRREVNELLRRYNEYTSTVSDLFLELHHRIENMEEAVGRHERMKRKEQASRF